MLKISVYMFGLGFYLKEDEKKVREGLWQAGIRSIALSVFFYRQMPETEKEKRVWEKGLDRCALLHGSGRRHLSSFYRISIPAGIMVHEIPQNT